MAQWYAKGPIVVRSAGAATSAIADANQPQIADTASAPQWMLLLLLAYALLTATYFIVRSWGQWAEVDTAAQAQAVRSILSSGSLIPTTGQVYPNGYGHGAISNALIALTGLDLSVLQQVAYPLVSALLVLPAWALYRELTGTNKAAALATLFLFLQPEFLFVILRGSHERELRALMLISLWLLVRSFRLRDKPGLFAIYAGLFYLTSYGLIATNALFGISFVLAIATAMGAAWVLGRVRRGFWAVDSQAAGRLATVSLLVGCLSFIFIFYVYPPAGFGLRAFEQLHQEVAALYLTTESEAGINPYSQVIQGWTSLPAYFLVSAEDYLLMASSVAVWLRLSWRWLRRVGEPPALAQWLLWLLYSAFAAQGALAVLSDRAGLLGQNLQLRSFPSFALLATPLVAVALSQWRPPPLGRVAVGVAVASLACLGLLKATNEPALSNKWTFYTADELQALDWADQHNRSGSIWVGQDERLRTAFAIAIGDSEELNFWDIAVPKPETRAFLISDVIQLQSARLGQPLPATVGEQRVYDGGSTQLYRLRPQTPYQR